MAYKNTFFLTKHLTVALNDQGKTIILIDGKEYTVCMRLVFNVYVEDIPKFASIKNIDDAVNVSEQISRKRGRTNTELTYEISPEEEFRGHCSNLQAWVEYDYNPNLLHSNLSWQLLRGLAAAGDEKAIRVYLYSLEDRISKGTLEMSLELLRNYQTYAGPEDKKRLLTMILAKGNFKAFLDLANKAWSAFDAEARNLLMTRIITQLAKKTRMPKNVFNAALQLANKAWRGIDGEARKCLLFLILMKGTKQDCFLDTMIHESRDRNANAVLKSISNFTFDDFEERHAFFDACRAMLNQVPHPEEFWVMAADVLDFMEEWRMGMNACHEALAVKHDDFDARIMLGKIQDHSGDWKGAFQYFHEMRSWNIANDYEKIMISSSEIIVVAGHLVKNPNSAEALHYYGRLTYYDGFVEDSIDCYRKALAIDPGDKNIWKDYHLVLTSGAVVTNPDSKIADNPCVPCMCLSACSSDLMAECNKLSSWISKAQRKP